MSSGNADPNRHVADLEMSDAMDGLSGQQVELFARFRHDTTALSLREFGISFVFEGRDSLPLIVIAHPPLERRACPGLRMT